MRRRDEATEAVRLFTESLGRQFVGSPLVLIPSFENGAYVSNCLEQLKSLGLTNFLVIDGGSTGESTRQVLEDLGNQNRVIRLSGNPGPRFFFENKNFFRALPDVFCVTDPDLEFNSNLPEDFTETLFALSVELEAGKVGFALSLEGDIKTDEFFFGGRWTTIKAWEARYWNELVDNSFGLPIYKAPIDTTFALYNKTFLKGKSFFNGYRVAGNFTAKHLPWHIHSPVISQSDPDSSLPRFSTWDLSQSERSAREAYERAQKKIRAMESSFSWKITAPLRFLGHQLTHVRRSWVFSKKNYWQSEK